MWTRLLWWPTFVGSWVRRGYERGWRVIDHVPDRARLWRAIVHAAIYKDGTIKPSFFRDNRGGLSCDIALLSSAEKSRHGYRQPPAWDPEKAGLVEFCAADVRACRDGSEGADVNHRPERKPGLLNYSHAQFSRKLSATEEHLMADAARVTFRPKK